MPEPIEPLVQTCEGCGSLIDVSDAEPFSLMHCPTCGNGLRARRRFRHFEILEVLGEGGMGTVYRALDTNLNRLVALKLLRKEYSAKPDFVRQFKTEAAVTASISHPHVIQVYSCEDDHGLLYIAMELVDKGSLENLMEVNGRVAEAQVLEVGLQIARGLNAALKAGLIHRDIKPGNILFSNAQTAKIVDFGLAALMDDAGKVGGEVWGTPYYVAPEKLDNQPEDVRSDIYSLGATLFHAVAGTPPFDTQTASMGTLKGIKSQPVSLSSFAPDVSSATAYVINKSLNVDPKQRHQNYEELIEHLNYALTELQKKAQAAEKEKGREAVETASQAKSTSWVTLAVIALVVITGVALFICPRNPTDERFASPPQVQNAEAIEPRFKAAREQLLSGNYVGATDALHQLDEESNLPQPLHNWITLHEGMAHLLAEQEEAARQSFQKVAERGPFSSDESELRMAKFFTEIAGVLQTEGPAPIATTQSYDRDTYQAFALFLVALKNWNAGNFEDAKTLMRRFHSASPSGPALWIGDDDDIRRLKEIAGNYITDYTAFRRGADALQSALTLEQKQNALQEAKSARSRVKASAKLAAVFDASLKEWELKVDAFREAQMGKTALQDAADSKILFEAKQKRSVLLAQFRFSEARLAILAPKLTGTKGQQQQEQLAERTEWLMKFKSLLIGDLNAAGYANPIQRRNGNLVTGGVGKADDRQLLVRTQYGMLPVPWAEISFESAYAMAQSFIRPGGPPEISASRKWLLGVFATFAGNTNQGRALLLEAAQLKPDYTAHLPLFVGPAENP